MSSEDFVAVCTQCHRPVTAPDKHEQRFCLNCGRNVSQADIVLVSKSKLPVPDAEE